MSAPRKKKSSRIDQKQKNKYSSVLGVNLELFKQIDSAAEENFIHTNNNFLAGGRRSTDKDDLGLYHYWKFLTEREQDVLILICKGLGDAEIGFLLSIGIPTVKSNIQRIFLKVNVRNRKQIMVRFRSFNFPRDIPLPPQID